MNLYETEGGGDNKTCHSRVEFSANSSWVFAATTNAAEPGRILLIIFVWLDK